MMRSSVVLPQPDGPEQRDELARREIEADVVQRDEVAERFADVADFNAHGASGSCS